MQDELDVNQNVIFSLVISLIVIIGSTWIIVPEISEYSQFKKDASEIEGVVTETNYHLLRKSKKYTIYYEFYIDNNRYSGSYEMGRSYREGSKIRILFDPTNPQSNHPVNYLSDQLVMIVFILLIIILFVLICFYLIYRLVKNIQRKQGKRKKAE
jgi:heme/copper-type cytochrome/quinol oxidase subunit 2